MERKTKKKKLYGWDRKKMQETSKREQEIIKMSEIIWLLVIQHKQ